ASRAPDPRGVRSETVLWGKFPTAPPKPEASGCTDLRACATNLCQMDVLIDADTVRSPELRHEIGVGIVDPFLYGERGGEAWAATSPLDAPSIGKVRPGLTQLDMAADLGILDLIAQGVPRDEALLEVRARACERMGVKRALVPPTFPLATADYLRARGIEL